MNVSNSKFVAPEKIGWISGSTRKAAVLCRCFLPRGARNVLFPSACLFVICVSSGCKNLRPVEDLTRHYVLSSPAAPSTTVNSNQNLTVGIAPVVIPGFLQSTRIAVRRDTNEIRYSEYGEWAEHLDKGIQRVLASDISALLPSARVITSAWQTGDVKAEVYVSIRRFELDESGEAVLDCEWRITPTGAPGTSRFNHSLIHKKGPPLATDPSRAVKSLSDALTDLSSEIATALQTL